MFGSSLRNMIARHSLGVGVREWPDVGPKIHLWIGNPGVDFVNGSEVSGSGYVAYQTDRMDWTVIANVGTNNTEFAFPEATAYWGIVDYIALTNGTGIWVNSEFYYGPLTSPKEIDEGSVAKFKVGALSIILL